MSKKTVYIFKDSYDNQISVYKEDTHAVLYKSAMENICIDEIDIDDLVSSLKSIKKEINKDELNKQA